MNNSSHNITFTRKLTLCGIMSALGVTLSVVSIPLGPAKCYPFQHTINVINGILLGPFWGLASAFTTSLIRNMLGTGSLFAFPGSMFGVLLTGLTALLLPGRKKLLSAIAEPFGTGIIGAWVSAAIVAPAMGRETAFTFMSASFLISSIPGAILGIVVISALVKRGNIKL